MRSRAEFRFEGMWDATACPESVLTFRNGLILGVRARFRAKEGSPSVGHPD